MDFLLLPFIGFLIGLLIVSLGGGGGGFYVGILTAIFDVPPAVAAATSLATIIPTTAIGSYSHWRAGNVNVRIGFIMMAGAIIGAITGSYLSTLFPASVYTKLTGALLIVMSGQMLLSDLRKRKMAASKSSGTTAVGLNTVNVTKAVIYGFLGGVMSGLVGVSGTGPVVAGLTVLGCTALQTVGTSVFVLVGISIAGFGMHLGLGNVDWSLVGRLVIGTASGAFLGTMVIRRLNKAVMEKVLPPILIAIVLIMGIVIFLK